MSLGECIDQKSHDGEPSQGYYALDFVNPHQVYGRRVTRVSILEAPKNWPFLPLALERGNFGIMSPQSIWINRYWNRMEIDMPVSGIIRGDRSIQLNERQLQMEGPEEGLKGLLHRRFGWFKKNRVRYPRPLSDYAEIFESALRETTERIDSIDTTYEEDGLILTAEIRTYILCITMQKRHLGDEHDVAFSMIGIPPELVRGDSESEEEHRERIETMRSSEIENHFNKGRESVRSFLGTFFKVLSSKINSLDIRPLGVRISEMRKEEENIVAPHITMGAMVAGGMLYSQAPHIIAPGPGHGGDSGPGPGPGGGPPMGGDGGGGIDGGGI